MEYSPCAKPCSQADACLVFSSSRTPTLSYTKQLESRVAELEEALSKLVGQHSSEASSVKGESPASPAEANASPSRRIKIVDGGTDNLDLIKEFEGLKVERDGRVSFHGPTSLFQLPSSATEHASPSARRVKDLGASRERLINNAWRERAFEQLSAIPVCIFDNRLVRQWLMRAFSLGALSIPS